MMFVPGLSLVVHLLIIFLAASLGAISRIKKPKSVILYLACDSEPHRLQRRRGSFSRQGFISLVVFLAVSSAASLGAVFSLNKSLNGQTNAMLLANLLKGDSRIALATFAGLLKMNNNGLPQVLSTSVEMDCMSNKTGTLDDTVSVFNFLENRDVNGSFDNRLNLAKQLDIPNYQGTAEQNLQMLALLRQNKTCLSKISTNSP